MLNIFIMSHFDTNKELPNDKSKKEKIGLLVGFQFEDGRNDLLLPVVHTIDELHYYYDQIRKIDNNIGVKQYAVEELFRRVNNPLDTDFDLNGFHLILFTTMDEVNHILNDDDCNSVGCFVNLFEGNPEATTINLVDFESWNGVVEMMKTTTQEEFLFKQKLFESL